MDGDERREQIIKILSENTLPVAGTELAARLGVSRQIIVQDIALLRAGNKNILSTNKGYILFHAEEGKKAYKRQKKGEAFLHKKSMLIFDIFMRKIEYSYVIK